MCYDSSQESCADFVWCHNRILKKEMARIVSITWWNRPGLPLLFFQYVGFNKLTMGPLMQSSMWKFIGLAVLLQTKFYTSTNDIRCPTSEAFHNTFMHFYFCKRNNEPVKVVHSYMPTCTNYSHFLKIGLLVKVEGADDVPDSFTYALAQNSSKLTEDVCDWLPLSPKYIPRTHIRYHELQSTRTRLQSMISTNEVETTAAVVVVNTNNNTHLTALISPVTKTPVVVVASSAGQKIQQIFSSQADRLVLCKIIPKVSSTLCKGLYFNFIIV